MCYNIVGADTRLNAVVCCGKAGVAHATSSGGSPHSHLVARTQRVHRGVYPLRTLEG